MSKIKFSSTLTHIGIRSFQFDDLTKLDLPNSVTHVEFGAFLCNQINEISFSQNLEFIGYSAFHKNRLTELNLPNSLIELDGFSQNQISQIRIPNSVKIIGFGAF